MNDREKVIRGLEHCSDPFMCDGNCPYYTAGDEISECTCYLAGDALELLKAQEDMVPIHAVADWLAGYAAPPVRSPIAIFGSWSAAWAKLLERFKGDAHEQN